MIVTKGSSRYRLRAGGRAARDAGSRPALSAGAQPRARWVALCITRRAQDRPIGEGYGSILQLEP